MHFVDPSLAANVPASHALQLALPVLAANLPGAQREQELCADPAWNCPASQGEHRLEPTVLKVPDPQLEQPVAAADA